MHKSCLSVESMVVLLDDPNRSTSFFLTLDKQLASENGDFYKDYQRFESEKREMAPGQIKERLVWFNQEYILEGAPKELNIPKQILAEFESSMKRNVFEIEILAGVRKEVLKMLYQNTYRLGDFEDEIPEESKPVFVVVKKSFMKRLIQRLGKGKRNT